MVVQPSSVAAEQVFSSLESPFSRNQSTSLDDYSPFLVILQYNKNNGKILLCVLIYFCENLPFNMRINGSPNGNNRLSFRE